MKTWQKICLCLGLVIGCCLGAALMAHGEEPRNGPLGLANWNGRLSLPYPSCAWRAKSVNDTRYDGAEIAPLEPATPAWQVVAGCSGVVAFGLVCLGAGVAGAWKKTEYSKAS